MYFSEGGKGERLFLKKKLPLYICTSTYLIQDFVNRCTKPAHNNIYNHKPRTDHVVDIMILYYMYTRHIAR